MEKYNSVVQVRGAEMAADDARRARAIERGVLQTRSRKEQRARTATTAARCNCP